MRRPAWITALLAVLIAAPAVLAQSSSDFQKLPSTLDPTGCPLGNQSARQEWAKRNDDKRTNETGCNAGETISECYKRQYKTN